MGRRWPCEAPPTVAQEGLARKSGTLRNTDRIAEIQSYITKERRKKEHLITRSDLCRRMTLTSPRRNAEDLVVKSKGESGDETGHASSAVRSSAKDQFKPFSRPISSASWKNPHDEQKAIAPSPCIFSFHLV
jgi:hypothetical protein